MIVHAPLGHPALVVHNLVGQTLELVVVGLRMLVGASSTHSVPGRMVQRSLGGLVAVVVAARRLTGKYFSHALLRLTETITFP